MRDFEFTVSYDSKKQKVKIEEPAYFGLLYDVENIDDVIDSIKDYIENFLNSKQIIKLKN